MPLAQWIEHLATNQEVGGSNPSGHVFGLVFLSLRLRNFRKNNNNIGRLEFCGGGGKKITGGS